MSISRNQEDLPKGLAVYTFLHGKTALERVDAILDEETSLYRTPAAGGVTFSLPNVRMIDFNHLLLFEGMTLEGGMSKRVTHLSYGSDSGKTCYTIQSPKNRVAQWVSGDYRVAIDAYPHRYKDGNLVKQELKRHLVAVPKGDERFIFLTFRDVSLEPVFKMVRSLPHEIVIETATSY